MFDYDFVLSAPDGGHSATCVMWWQFGLRWEARVIVDGETWGWEICAGSEPTQNDISTGKYEAMTAALWAPIKVTMTELRGGETQASELFLARKGTVHVANGMTLATLASGRRDARDARFGLKIHAP